MARTAREPIRAAPDRLTGGARIVQAARDVGAWARRARVIDATLLFNEIDLLEIRLNELDPHVDHFVVVEGNLTFSGAPKPWFFPEYRTRFARFASKLVYHQADLGPPRPRATQSDRLVLEVRQRNAIAAAVRTLSPARKDIVIVSDVDEIPRAARVAELPERLARADVCPFVQLNHRGYINNRSTQRLNRRAWVGSVACRYRLFLHAECQEIRMNYGAASRPLRERHAGRGYIDDGGWHFSSLGGWEAASLKAQHSVHVEDRFHVIEASDRIVPVQVFTGDFPREAARAAQNGYLAQGGNNDFTPLDYDRFTLDGDLPAYLVAERERFRRFFFFTDLA